MATPNRDAIETFVSVTGASELIALQKLQEHAGNLNEAVDAYFSEGDRNITHVTSTVVPQDDLMDIDDPVQVEPSLPPFSLLSSARNMYPFSLLNPNFIRNIFDYVTDITSAAPVVSHPREVREIPIEVQDENELSGHSGLAPIIQDITGTTHEHDPGIEGTVTFDEEDDDFPTARIAPWGEGNGDTLDDYVRVVHYRPSAPGMDDLPGYNNDIEEEMIQAAIQASKLDAEIHDLHQVDHMPQQRQPHQEDAELEHAVSLSLKTAEEENAARVLSNRFGQSEAFKSEINVQDEVASSYGRLEAGESTSLDVTDDIKEKAVVRHRNRIISTNSVNPGNEVGETEVRSSSSVQWNSASHRSQLKEIDSLLDQEMERRLAAKETCLPPEPPSDDVNAVTLLVRMPDGSRLGRRFLKSHKLQYLFDFIDVAQVVKPDTYRLTRPYPRRAFTPDENAATFNELGFSGRQETLFLELI